MKKQKHSLPAFSDLLNYAYFVDEGIILNKDGAFLTTYQFSGPDLFSASAGEIDSLVMQMNRLFLLLDDGWMVHVDEIRVPSVKYPAQGYFPDVVSKLIDDERRITYQDEAQHFENHQYITIVWKFPLAVVNKTKHWFIHQEKIDGTKEKKDAKENSDLTNSLLFFKETIQRCLSQIAGTLHFQALSSKELLSFLHACITGVFKPIALPNDSAPLDMLLSRHEVVSGFMPKIADKSIAVLSMVGYLNPEVSAGMLQAMATYPLVYRCSHRFVPLSTLTAEREIKRYRKNWHNKVKGFSGVVREILSGKTSDKQDRDAMLMEEQANDALTANSSLMTRFGYYTGLVILMHEDVLVLDEAYKTIRQYLEQQGFSCVKENINAFNAYLGSIPGHGEHNIRRLFMDSETVSAILPLQTIWTGDAVSHTSSLLPKNSPAVFYAATTGHTPFRFQLDVSDVGHQLVLGPTGSGKSTYLDFLIAQFFRYENARVYLFDKDQSHLGLTKALSGDYIDLGGMSTLSFAPLIRLETESEKIRAAQWVEHLVQLQKIELIPNHRQAIFTAIESLSKQSNVSQRNLTVLSSIIQDKVIREALAYYTISGSFKLLDATKPLLTNAHLQTFEMNWLLQQKPEIYVPILNVLFNEIETYLEDNQGKYPVLIVLEEAWLFIQHEIFAATLKDWLKTLRKKNARVIFATQSLSDLYEPSTGRLSQTTASILESCPTKVYLPNPAMDNEIQSLYEKMGLSQRQIEIIHKIARAKQHYYVVTPNGNRLIDLALKNRSIARAFIGLSKEKTNAFLEYQKSFKQDWLEKWLRQETENGVSLLKNKIAKSSLDTFSENSRNENIKVNGKHNSHATFEMIELFEEKNDFVLTGNESG